MTSAKRVWAEPARYGLWALGVLGAILASFAVGGGVTIFMGRLIVDMWAAVFA